MSRSVEITKAIEQLTEAVIGKPDPSLTSREEKLREILALVLLATAAMVAGAIGLGHGEIEKALHRAITLYDGPEPGKPADTSASKQGVNWST